MHAARYRESGRTWRRGSQKPPRRGPRRASVPTPNSAAHSRQAATTAARSRRVGHPVQRGHDPGREPSLQRRRLARRPAPRAATRSRRRGRSRARRARRGRASGTPLAAASSTTSPQPSPSEAQTCRRAPVTAAYFSSSGTNPCSRTASPIPSRSTSVRTDGQRRPGPEDVDDQRRPSRQHERDGAHHVLDPLVGDHPPEHDHPFLRRGRPGAGDVGLGRLGDVVDHPHVSAPPQPVAHLGDGRLRHRDGRHPAVDARHQPALEEPAQAGQRPGQGQPELVLVDVVDGEHDRASAGRGPAA